MQTRKFTVAVADSGLTTGIRSCELTIEHSIDFLLRFIPISLREHGVQLQSADFRAFAFDSQRWLAHDELLGHLPEVTPPMTM